MYRQIMLNENIQRANFTLDHFCRPARLYFRYAGEEIGTVPPLSAPRREAQAFMGGAYAVQFEHPAFQSPLVFPLTQATELQQRLDLFSYLAMPFWSLDRPQHAHAVSSPSKAKLLKVFQVLFNIENMGDFEQWTRHLWIIDPPHVDWDAAGDILRYEVGGYRHHPDYRTLPKEFFDILCEVPEHARANHLLHEVRLRQPAPDDRRLTYDERCNALMNWNTDRIDDIGTRIGATFSPNPAYDYPPNAECSILSPDMLQRVLAVFEGRGHAIRRIRAHTDVQAGDAVYATAPEQTDGALVPRGALVYTDDRDHALPEGEVEPQPVSDDVAEFIEELDTLLEEDMGQPVEDDGYLPKALPTG